jgi:uncharacterized protein YpuA (DUF1002 family)
MNKRIQEITGQVLDELVPETWTRLGYDKIKEIQNRTAELIVAEAIAVLQKRFMGDLNREDMEIRRCVEDVKKHFGVNPNEITTAMLDTSINQIEEYKKYVAQQQKENLPHISYGSWELYNKPKKKQ